MTYEEASEKIRAFVRAVVEENLEFFCPQNSAYSTLNRSIVILLQMAWADAVRSEFYGTINDADSGDLKDQLQVAKEWMKEEHSYLNGIDSVGMHLGIEAQVVVVDGKKSVSLEHCMVGAVPLSAIYLNKVREALDVAERIKALADMGKEPC